MSSSETSPVSKGAELPLPAWGHASGMLSLGNPVSPGSPGAVADRLLITERIARYCWAYDERRRDALADCFSEDGVWEGSVLGKIPVGPFQGRDRIAQWLTEFWPHQHDQRRHMLLNTIVEEQSAESALTLSYLLLLGSDGRKVNLETSGFYRVQYVRAGGKWWIERLTAGFDAPFWPGDIDKMSSRGRTRHGVGVEESHADSSV